MKYKTNKLRQLEKSRKSVITVDLERCYICKRPKDDLHEIFPGRNRLNSIKYGFVLPLCRYHHQMIHTNSKMANEFKKECQKIYEKDHSRAEWFEVFKKNYLD